jgi:hypothetical protein
MSKSPASSNRTAANLQHEALEAAKAMASQVDESNFTLGGVLNHIYAEGIHKTAGYDGKRGFANYVEKELGIEYRKAMELRTICMIYSQAGVDETRLSEIGWSKAKELARLGVDTLRSNFNALAEFAVAHTRKELIEHIRTTYQSAAPDTGDELIERLRSAYQSAVPQRRQDAAPRHRRIAAPEEASQEPTTIIPAAQMAAE